jgi:hypothetical protein
MKTESPGVPSGARDEETTTTNDQGHFTASPGTNGTHNGNSNQLDFAKRLGQLLGVPLVTCKPAAGKDEFHYPPGDRDSLTADDNQNQLGRFRPGSAVMARTGDPLAVVDVDPKNNGDIEKTRQLLDGLNVRIFAEIATPGDGRHFYIAGLPDLPSCSNLNEWPGIDVLSHSRLVFLPGTQRPKYNGAGYRVIYDNLEALADGGDPDGAEAFADWVAERRGDQDPFETTSPWQGGEPDPRQATYLAKMLGGMHRDLTGMSKDSGRNIAVYNKALKCGNYIAGAGLNETVAIDVLLDACRHNGLVQEDGERSVLASIRSGIKNGKIRPRAVPDSKSTGPSTNGSTPHSGPPKAALAALLTDLRTWQDLPDPVHIIVNIAAAATRNADGEPCWLLNVAPPVLRQNRRCTHPRQHRRRPPRRSNRRRPARMVKRERRQTHRRTRPRRRKSTRHIRRHVIPTRHLRPRRPRPSVRPPT